MKKIHIVLVVIIALSIGAIMTTMSDASTYADFREAFNNPGHEYHVVGRLNRDKPAVYDPHTDANLFSFYMKDNTGTEKKVVLHKSKPQDFEHSEQIVVIGGAAGEDFQAGDILMKCPSKYTEGQPEIGKQ